MVMTHMAIESFVHIVFHEDRQNQPGKVAEAEMHFIAGPLVGMKLVGFAVWERRTGGHNVTFPARQYAVNGERRSFALFRPVSDTASQDVIRDFIIAQWKAHRAAVDAAVEA